MAAPFGSFPFNAAGIDQVSFPPVVQWYRAPSSNDTQYPIGTRIANISTLPATLYEYAGSGLWETGGNVQATTTVAGITRYATTLEVATGAGTNNAALAADVFAYGQSIVTGAVAAATETNPGIAEIATQVELH